MKVIIPFSNGSEFTHWCENNCYQCCNYDNKSVNRETANCKYIWDIEIASVSDGTIPEETAKAIGMTNGRLNPQCFYKNFVLTPVKINTSWMFQRKLF